MNCPRAMLAVARAVEDADGRPGAWIDVASASAVLALTAAGQHHRPSRRTRGPAGERGP